MLARPPVGVLVVTMADRESDFFEFLKRCTWRPRSQARARRQQGLHTDVGEQRTYPGSSQTCRSTGLSRLFWAYGIYRPL